MSWNDQKKKDFNSSVSLGMPITLDDALKVKASALDNRP